MDAKAVAAWVRRSYGASLNGICHSRRLLVIERPLKGRLQEVYLNGVIILKRGLSFPKRRHLIAHALGHHFLRQGNHLYLNERSHLFRSEHERQAEAFAAHLLIPDDLLPPHLHRPPWELAKRFQVPEAFTQFRLWLWQQEKASRRGRWGLNSGGCDPARFTRLRFGSFPLT